MLKTKICFPGARAAPMLRRSWVDAKANQFPHERPNGWSCESPLVRRVAGGDSSCSAHACVVDRSQASTKRDLTGDFRVGTRIGTVGQHEICHGTERPAAAQA